MSQPIKNYLTKSDRPVLSAAPDRPTNALKPGVNMHGLQAPVAPVSKDAAPRPANHIPSPNSPARRARPSAAPANGLDAAMSKLADRMTRPRGRKR